MEETRHRGKPIDLLLHTLRQGVEDTKRPVFEPDLPALDLSFDYLPRQRTQNDKRPTRRVKKARLKTSNTRPEMSVQCTSAVTVAERGTDGKEKEDKKYPYDNSYG